MVVNNVTSDAVLPAANALIFNVYNSLLACVPDSLDAVGDRERTEMKGEKKERKKERGDTKTVLSAARIEATRGQ